MECSGCHASILPGNPIIGHVKNRRLEHIHHQACFIAKIAEKWICPVCKEPLGKFLLDSSLPSHEKEAMREVVLLKHRYIEEHRIVEAVRNDPWLKVKAAVVGGVAGGFAGAILPHVIISFTAYSLAAIAITACLLTAVSYYR